MSKLNYFVPTSFGGVQISGTMEVITGAKLLEKGEGKSTRTPLFLEAAKQIHDYFDKKRTFFELPLSYRGTDFQMRVWYELLKIPYAEVRTYGEIGSLLGKKQAAQAVGNACSSNPIGLLIPCHRVVGKSKLGGYTCELPLKKYLLELEGAN